MLLVENALRILTECSNSGPSKLVHCSIALDSLLNLAFSAMKKMERAFGLIWRQVTQGHKQNERRDFLFLMVTTILGK
jgi:hypothetical protein